MSELRVKLVDRGDFATRSIAWDLLREVPRIKKTPVDVVDLLECLHAKPYSVAINAGVGLLANNRASLVWPNNDECRDHLRRLGLAKFYRDDGASNPIDLRSTNVPIEHLDSTPGMFADAAVNAWTAGGRDLGPRVWADLKIHLDEVIRNALTHAESSIGCVVCGQVFPTKRHLEIAILDFGQTIKSHLTKNPKHRGIRSDFDAIVKATADAVTGTPDGRFNRWNEQNSGAGLYELRRYCESGGGECAIVSGMSMVLLGPGTTPENIPVYKGFPGCLVNIRFNLDWSQGIDETTIRW